MARGGAHAVPHLELVPLVEMSGDLLFRFSLIVPLVCIINPKAGGTFAFHTAKSSYWKKLLLKHIFILHFVNASKNNFLLCCLCIKLHNVLCCFL